MPVTLDDGTLVKVPIGEDEVTHPETGATLVVRWGQDESGSLVVTDIKPKKAAAGATAEVVAAADKAAAD